MRASLARTTRTAIALGLVAPMTALALTGASTAATPGSTLDPTGSASHSSWIQTWGTAHTPPADKGISADGFTDQTVRMIAHTSLGGDGLRIRISNEYGELPLDVGTVTVGLQDTGASVETGSTHTLTFGDDESFVIPAGAEAYSDPVPMRVPKLTNLVVSVYLPEATGPTSWHPDAGQTTYLADGNQTGDLAGDAYTDTVESWFYLEGIAVRSRHSRGSVVAFGDSITDGVDSTVDANHRWPDYLSRRLNEHGNLGRVGIANAGISGNRVITNAGVCCGGGWNFGESALTRFADDAAGNAAARTVIFVEGINDIGNNAGAHPDEPLTAEQLINGMQSIIAQAHAKGLRIIGGTLLPYKGAAYYTERGERIRQQVNDWIRTSGAFDGVVDFDRATRDPEHPKRLRPAYDSGDHLHPNDTGYRTMAEAVDLRMLH